MAYNRWMPRQYYNGGELYHYGVKGMKWKHHKNPLQTAYDAMGGAAEREWNEAVDGRNINFADSRLKYEYWQKQKNYLKSPVGRVKAFRDRMRDIKDDVVYDDTAKTPKQKGKLLVKYLIDYIKNG